MALSEQFLNYRYSRLLVTMEKIKPLDEEEEAAIAAQHVPVQYVCGGVCCGLLTRLSLITGCQSIAYQSW